MMFTFQLFDGVGPEPQNMVISTVPGLLRRVDVVSRRGRIRPIVQTILTRGHRRIYHCQHLQPRRVAETSRK
jgi:hypothetical protein